MENEFSLICMTDKQFFFYLFNRRSYAGDLELVKKKKSGEKPLEAEWERGDVCGSKTDPSGPAASLALHLSLLPGDIFSLS